MIHKGVIHFCSGVPLSEMVDKTDREWGILWRKRIADYYLAPAKRRRRGFPAMILACAAIEGIGSMLFPPDNPRDWIKESGNRFRETVCHLIPEITDAVARILYKHYRCGLVHNGRTNQLGEGRQPNELSAISFDIETIFEQHQRDGHTLYVINPRRLVAHLSDGLHQHTNDNLERLGRFIRENFNDDLAMARVFEDYLTH
jgi:hypothetical protein